MQACRLKPVRWTFEHQTSNAGACGLHPDPIKPRRDIKLPTLLRERYPHLQTGSCIGDRECIADLRYVLILLKIEFKAHPVV